MSMLTTVMQRVRVVFAVGWPLQYASILDMGRLWERLLRRAELPLAYTQGYNPHARLQFADALPVGYTSACEMLDIYLGEPVDLEELPDRLQAQAPPGLGIVSAAEVALDAKAPQSLMREAVYQVSLRTDLQAAEIAAALSELLLRTSIPFERERRGRVQSLELRELIHGLGYVSEDRPWHEVHMRLRCRSNGSGRPADVLDAAGLAYTDLRVHRTQLIWEERSS